MSQVTTADVKKLRELTGAGMLGQNPFWQEAVDQPLSIGHAVLAIDVGRFMEPGEFRARMAWLANALKTVPSPAAALDSIVPVLPQPMQQEIERMLKEIRIGGTLEQALLNMSSRLKSPDVDAALSSLLIGLQVGGNLQRVLETTAGTIREMARLQGVIRTKTADARVQLWVLALFPFGICWAFVLLDPTFFWPLEQTFVGNLIAAVAVTLWLVALVTARKVLKVDI